MALTEIYVDPSIAADSGAGTIGDPYGDLEYAIEQTTFDTTNGTRVNILAGTDEILAAELSLAMEDTSVSVAWAPSVTAKCIFQGYTATAGDGGIGGISGGGSVSIYNETSGKDFISFVDLHLHNTGANNVLDMDDHCSVINCEVNNSTGIGINMSLWPYVSGCYVHDVGSAGIVLGERGSAWFNFVDMDTASSKGIELTGPGTVSRNIVIAAPSAGDGIKGRSESILINNSVFAIAGTGSGIWSFAGGEYCAEISNNLVEGFSGTGGVGIDFNVTNSGAGVFRGNSVYNCTTEYASRPVPSIVEDDNETLTASPFTAAATNDFSPVDTGNVKEGSLPDAIAGP